MKKVYSIYMMAILLLALCCSGSTVILAEDAPVFSIDNDSVYDGMSRSYANGYVPEVRDGFAYVMLPLQCSVPLSGNAINMKLNTGTMDTPFVNKNYDVDIGLQPYVNSDGVCKELYFIYISLELKTDRINGSYPVVFDISATDTEGRYIQQSFTVYVNISDGKNPNEPEPTNEPEVTEEEIIYAPRIIIKSVKSDKKEIFSGDSVEYTVTLQNTSEDKNICNMTISVAAENSCFSLFGASDTIYIDGIGAGECYDLVLKLSINRNTACGQYNIPISMNYADEKGITYSESANAKITISPFTNIELGDISVPNSAKAGEKIEASFQAVNLGRSKLYNVRASISCDGLVPDGLLYIGDMEAQSEASATTKISVFSLSEGGSLYGTTKGTVTYMYEDENGKEYSEEREILFAVQNPYEDEPKKEEDDTSQWFAIMCVLIFILIIILTGNLIKYSKRRFRRKSN